MTKSLLLFFLLLPFFSFSQDPGVSGELQKINEILPSEKIYLHTDRTFYSITDDIYFKAYILNGETYFPTTVSSSVSVNLLDAKGNIVDKTELMINNGTAAGAFSFTNKAGGIYTIKAFTNWTGNLGNEYIFEKEIIIQKINYPLLLLKMETEKKSYLPGQTVNGWIKVNNLENQPVSGKPVICRVLYNGNTIATPSVITNNEGKGIISFHLPDSISRNDVLINAVVEHEGKTESINKPVIIDLDEITVDFLPEGGNMVNGLTCTVAFRAVKSNGKPADIKGAITDETGKLICDFESLKFGMGKFVFTPEAGHRYSAVIASKIKTNKKYPLPESQNSGVALSCSKKDEDEYFVRISTTADKEIIFLSQLHGRILQKEKIKISGNENHIPVKTSTLPAGIMQVTIFDAATMAPLAERLIFINKKNTLNVSITTDKEKYTPFEKVNMKIKVTDGENHPVKGNFSLSVADEKNLTLADYKQDHILSYLLMSSELKGKIEEPSFYFKEDEPLANEALDLVMLTHGWRRYTWNEVLAHSEEDWKKKILFPKANTLYFGTVIKPYYASYVSHNKLKIKPAGYGKSVTPDSLGNFSFPSDEVTLPVTLKIKQRWYTETIRYVSSRHLYMQGTRITFNPLKASGSFSQGIIIPEQDGKKTKAEEISGIKTNINENNTLTITREDIANIPVISGTRDLELSEVLIMSNGVSADQSYISLKTVNSLMVTYSNSFLTPNYGYSWPTTYSSDNRYELKEHYNNMSYYYGKQFYSPKYNAEKTNFNKITDNRTTLYWNHNIQTDVEGESEVEFYNAQNTSSFHAILEGVSENGIPGRGEFVFYTQKPLTLEAKLPLVVTKGDRFSVSCVISNHTQRETEARLNISASAGLNATDEFKEIICKIPADSFVVKEISFEAVQATATKSQITLSVENEKYTDRVQQNIVINQSGFEHYAVTGGNEKTKTYSFIINEPVNQEISASFEMILNPYVEMEKTLAGMMREPHGCFEQVSSSNYPNILALKFLKQSGKADPELTQKATQLLNSGYKQLAKYETSEGGFEWYGNNPPHESLTAMGLMQFKEMRDLGIETDEKLFERTLQWLMKRRTKEGVFLQNPGKYGFSSAPRETASAYITYALACMGEKNLEKEIAFIQNDISKKFDFYKASLLANIYFKTGNSEKGKETVQLLVNHLRKNSIEKMVTGPSVTYNNSPQTECLALLSIAIAENQLTDFTKELDDYVKYIYSKRSYGGYFGNTQTTVLCLEAIIAKKMFLNSTETAEGSLTIAINDAQPVIYNYGKETDVMDKKLGTFLKQGKNTVKINFQSDGKKIPYYNFYASWREALPGEGKESKVIVSSSFSRQHYKKGDAAQMKVNVKNITSSGLPQTVAVIGIPAGLDFDSHELKRLKEDKLFDYYELKDNYLILYYAELAPSADINIPLNLKAEQKGTFTTPPSCAYLYYNNENKSWCQIPPVTIE
ncbi:MAG: alpha-2-macroglobulin family protein [Bacteroidota bacterium]